VAYVVTGIRDATWFNRDRVDAYAPLVLFGMAVSPIVWGLAGVDLAGDFRSFWAASVLTLRGSAALAYNPAVHQAVEATVPGMAQGEWAAFLYPPIYLLICAPLALLPFAASAVAWVVGTSALFWAAMRPLLPRTWGAACAMGAFPAVWVNAAAGQNGALTAALLVFGFRLLDRAPVLAGVCFGCLAYKPQFALVLPIALLAASRWRAAASAALMVLALVAVTLVLFGADPWRAFLQEASVIRAAVGGLESPGRLLSGMGASVWLGLPPAWAPAVQVVVTGTGCLALLLFARRIRTALPLGAATCVCSAFASPWLHNYDLTLLALPVAWLVSRGCATGFRPWEKMVAFAAYLGPMLAVPLTDRTHLPWVLLLLAATGAAVARRAAYDAADLDGEPYDR
jgi:hypothetical protein